MSNVQSVQGLSFPHFSKHKLGGGSNPLTPANAPIEPLRDGFSACGCVNGHGG
jgi:hypothetical protein